MTKPALGTKRTCKSCETRFFDLGKSAPVCPKCGEVVAVASPPRTKRGTPPPQPAPEKAAPQKANDNPPNTANDDPPDTADVDIVVADPVEDDDAEDIDDGGGGEDALIEDTSDLGQDDDDVSEVLDHVDEGVTDK